MSNGLYHHRRSGNGKTTTINTIIHYFDQEDMDILAAPPRSKRMTEATGYEAKTIHDFGAYGASAGSEKQRQFRRTGRAAF
ncbi:MAG: AAA family ATPase [Pilosibacter sp.]